MTPLWGITALQEHTFTSSASDPDEDTLTYRWNETNTGAMLSEAASFVHTFNNLAGTETKEITLTVQDADGLSTSSHVAVTSISLTGTWVSDRGLPGNYGGSKLLNFFLTQSAGDASTGHFQPRPHYKDFSGFVTGTGEWASFLLELGPEGEPGIVRADGHVRIRAKWINDDFGNDGFIFQSIDGGAGSFDFTPAQGVTMKGEINGAGINDYLLTFTQQ